MEQKEEVEDDGYIEPWMPPEWYAKEWTPFPKIDVGIVLPTTRELVATRVAAAAAAAEATAAATAAAACQRADANMLWQQRQLK